MYSDGEKMRYFGNCKSYWNHLESRNIAQMGGELIQEIYPQKSTKLAKEELKKLRENI